MKKILISSILAAVISLTGMPIAMADGAADYAAKCASCHGADGKGKAAMATAFKVDPAKLDLTDNDAASCVKVVTNGQGTMKPVAGLDTAQIQELCNYSNSL